MKDCRIGLREKCERCVLDNVGLNFVQAMHSDNLGRVRCFESSSIKIRNGHRSQQRKSMIYDSCEWFISTSGLGSVSV